MDTIRLFLRSNSVRNSKRKADITATYSRTVSNDNLSIAIDDKPNASNEKLSRENIKSFLSTHPPSALSHLPIRRLDLETCSGLSTASSENIKDPIIAASASESVSNVLTFTDNHSSKRRRSSLTNNKRRQRRRSSLPECNIHHTPPSFRRIKSHRYPDRIRKHSIKSKPSTEKLTRRYIQPFQSTYRLRNEEFRKIFKDLPNDERLVVDYSCAWQKDILIQGRMYLSQNYLCFHANILNWKTSLCLKFQDIVGITREKTAKVISNAIEVKINKGEKFFFASFVTRDKTYQTIYRIWQTTLIEQPMSNQQLWTMIHESYGDDLDMTTDEEDTYHKSSFNSPKQQIQSNEKYDLSNIVLRVTPKSIQIEDDRSSISSRGEHQTDDENIIPTGEETTTDTFNQDMNTTSENVEINYLTQCLCQSHLATELINRTYSMTVEQLFDFIFGDNDFLVAYRASRRIKEYHASEWQMNNETGKRERLCTYKVTVAAPVFGSQTICSNERQFIDNELSKSYYIIDTEVRNEGIKYADAFFVASRYCLLQIGPNKSHLKLTCEVRYVKSLMAIIKTFIEKNAMAALQDSFTDLRKRIDNESIKRSRAFNSSNNNEKEKVIQSESVSNIRSSSRQQEQINELTSSMNDLSINSQEEESTYDQINSDVIPPNSLFSSKNIFLTSFCLITILLLLIVNIFLCIKLNRIDQMTDRLVQNYPVWLNRYSHQQEDNEWSSLLKRQEEYYQTQLTGLHTVLMTTHNALRNVTDALHQLSKLSGGSR